MKTTAKITCPNCGPVPLHSVTIYNDSLRKQNFSLSPILPTCTVCDSDVEVIGDTRGVKILLLNGTCGSGKSSTAEELVKSHGFVAIDGDNVMRVIEHKLGVRRIDFDSPEVFEEIGKEIDIMAALGNKIVLTYVVMPKDLQKFKDIFERKGMDYRIILLKPSYEIAVKRAQTRTCFTSVTPEEWVRHFYDALDCDDVFNNSDLTVQQSAVEILQLAFG